MAKGKNTKKRKKEEKKIEVVQGNDTNIWNKVFIVLGILCFFLAFYLLTLYITHKNSNSSDTSNDDTPQETVISYDNIMLGRSLSMEDGEYYVIYYDGSDEDISSTYSSLVSSYRSKEEHLSIYYVDMSSGFNKSYVTEEESNKSPATVSDLSIHGPTLILVDNHAVKEYIEGEEKITERLS